MLHAGSALKSWLNNFLSSCMRQLKLPKIWRRTLVVVVPKRNKHLGDPKSCKPMCLLCVPFKILERLIYACVEPIIDPLLPREQAEFRRGRSTIDLVTPLTQERIAFSLKRRPALCSLISEQLTILYGTAVSPANYSVFLRTGI